MAALGVDFLICQGTEAGGHVQSTTPLHDLLPAVVEASDGIPVIAAGGLATREDVTRVLSWGASGAMLGTRFVATQESRAHPLYKAALLEGTETALTVCFSGGWAQAAHRVLRNATIEAWEAAGSPPEGARPGEGEVVAQAASGEPILRYEDTAPRVGMTGNIAAMCLYAGTGVGKITDLPSASAVVAVLLPTGVL
jgi:NAD(P)H-dependent flavin oxidoreductase YrpB (nitropropane dioxygenase family)